MERRELHNIGNKPSGEFVFMVNDYSSLGAIKEMLAIKTCRGVQLFITTVYVSEILS